MSTVAETLFTAAASFEAACQVHSLPAGHRATRLHGHSYTAEIRTRLASGWGGIAGGEVDALQAALVNAVAPLDYRYLNDHLASPTDENIARWIRQQLAPLSLATEVVGIQSTSDSGVDLDEADHAHLWRRYVFQSAHVLPNVPVGHKCGRMHGHGFEVILHAQAASAGRDYTIDYDHLDSLWAPLHAQLDHACLNDLPGLENPTSENLSAWIWQRLKPQLPELSWVTVYETGTCGAHFDGKHYRIWKDITLDSAVRLKRAPAGDPRARIHGHTYTLRLHLHADLDTVAGWIVDFGDVKTVFDPVFKLMDHQPLYEIVGDRDADTLSLAQFVRELAQPLIPALDRLDLYQTRGCGVILHWGEPGPALPV